MENNDHVYNNIFQTLRSFHPKLFIPYINEWFGKSYGKDAKVQIVTREGILLEKRMDGSVNPLERPSFSIIY